jgi:hypothetical protein
MVYNMPIWLRRWIYNRRQEYYKPKEESKPTNDIPPKTNKIPVPDYIYNKKNK